MHARAAPPQPATAIQGTGIGAAAWDGARRLQQTAPHAPCWRRPALPEKMRTCSASVKPFPRRGGEVERGGVPTMAASLRSIEASSGRQVDKSPVDYPRARSWSGIHARGSSSGSV